jgi:hypothetical protein
MSNQWFRMYAEVLNDPKVQKLPAELFKVWINTLCLACNNNGTLPKLEDCSFAFRETISETKTAFHELEKHGLIVTDGETFHIHNWKKRQYKSDNSTERVKRHRNARKNVTETPQNRTEQIQIKNIKKDHPEIPNWIPKRDWSDWIAQRKTKPSARAIEIAIAKLASLREKGHLPERVLQQSIMRGYTGLFPVNDDDIKIIKPKEIRANVKTIGGLNA